MDSSELTTGLYGVGGVVLALVILITVLVKLSSKKKKRMEEGRRKLIDRYGLSDLPNRGFGGTVDGISITISKSKMPIPANEFQHDVQRIKRRVTKRETVLQVTAERPDEPSWFLCENRDECRYVDDVDKEKLHTWFEYYLAKFNIPTTWSMVSASKAFNERFLLCSEDGAPPPFVGQKSIVQAIMTWCGERAALRILFVNAQQGKITTRALCKSLEQDELGEFEDIDRTVRLILALCNPAKAAEYLDQQNTTTQGDKR
jgi:hypothetical protein